MFFSVCGYSSGRVGWSFTGSEPIGGAILLGVIGHFDAGECAAVLAELAARLPVGGAALVDLQEPERPQRVEAYEFTHPAPEVFAEQASAVGLELCRIGETTSWLLVRVGA